MTPTDSWTRGRFTVEMLKKRGVALLLLEEKIDTPSAAGELVFHVFGTIAQFERRLIAERTYDGMTAARAKERTAVRRSTTTNSMPLTQAKFPKI
jgi:DNA invertase Pin-like site-specific DNA recombinase